jgi:hypothetical protein
MNCKEAVSNDRDSLFLFLPNWQRLFSYSLLSGSTLLLRHALFLIITYNSPEPKVLSAL